MRVLLRGALLTLALSVAILTAFLLWRGLTVECPAWDEEETDTAVLARR